MTSRLKRKLNDLGVDPASAKANESFCLIGTPLPPLEKSRDTGEYVPLWKQEVRDEKGRRRLHGAFTGGFSAGYFNSVGSKEGWAPSTFVSSRSERAKQKAARPEDFMDEEDLAELAEGRKLVDTHEEMDFGGTEAELRRRAGVEDSESDSIATALEASLAPPPTDSVGARILRKMGWRVGQGIGPRLTFAQRKAQDAGFMDYSREAQGDDGDEEAKKHTYPRRDTPVIVAQRKENSHGIGYVPGMSLQESLGSRRGDATSKGPNIAAGFGLGALNDADEDDLDVYDSGMSKQARARMAYDAEDADDDNFVSMGSARTRDRGRGHDSRKPSGITQTFNDGRPVLPGFVLSDKPVAEDRWFPLPEIPKGWTPDPSRVWNKDKDKENIAQEDGGARTKQPPKTHAEWKDSFMSANERGSLLGETPLPPKTLSVFEYMSQKDRERLQNIRNAPRPASGTPTPSTPTPAPSVLQFTPGEINIPELHPSVAKAALQGFQPFSADPVKQSRYTAFLQYQANRGDAQSQGTLAIGRLPGQSVEEFNKELSDYAKSATVFKPLSGAMAGRFTSAVVVENGPKIVEGLHTPAPADETSTEEEKKEKEREKEDPKMGAVRLGMYGPLTRDVQPWQPAKLLCKRFGVKDPEVNTDVTDAAEGKSSASSMAQKVGWSSDPTTQDASSHAAETTTTTLAITDGSSGNTSRSSGPRNLANVGLGEDETQGRDTLTYQRPSMDIFKAIFASDDEDSDNDDNDGNDKVGELAAESSPGPKSEPIAAHLTGESATPVNYDPLASSSAAPTNGQEKVDLASFKPTFVPRSERESRKEKGKEKDKSKKDKKSAPKMALSFDVEEEGLSLNLSAPSRKEKKHKDKDKDKDRDGDRKRKKRKEKQEEDEDDSMWVEKPPAEAVKTLPSDHLEPSSIDGPTMGDSFRDQSTQDTGPPRGRKRAIDFM